MGGWQKISTAVPGMDANMPLTTRYLNRMIPVVPHLKACVCARCLVVCLLELQKLCDCWKLNSLISHKKKKKSETGTAKCPCKLAPKRTQESYFEFPDRETKKGCGNAS